MVQLTVRKIGNSLGVILPAEATAVLEVGEGDKLFLTQSPEGFRITPYDPAFERQIKVAAKGMKKYRNALRDLAKRGRNGRGSRSMSGWRCRSSLWLNTAATPGSETWGCSTPRSRPRSTIMRTAS